MKTSEPTITVSQDYVKIMKKVLQLITVHMKGLICHCSTDQDGSIDLMSICFDLGIGNGVVIQHSLEVGPVGRKVWKEHSLNSLPTETDKGLWECWDYPLPDYWGDIKTSKPRMEQKEEYWRHYKNYLEQWNLGEDKVLYYSKVVSQTLVQYSYTPVESQLGIAWFSGLIHSFFCIGCFFCLTASNIKHY